MEEILKGEEQKVISSNLISLQENYKTDDPHAH